jgi:YVTN family beta-propeller protein
MDFRILGALELRDDRGELSLGGGKQRSLLALLLIHPNESLSTDRLIDELWGERAPPTAAKIVQNYVSQLRRVLGDDRLQTQTRGYALRVEPAELDVDRFRQQFEEAKRASAAGDPERASLLLREALVLWRGPPLADFTYESFAGAEISRLEELHLSATAERIDLDLALGRHADVIGELEVLVAANPQLERLTGQLMLALYRSGRQAEALQLYQKSRRRLADELGIEPDESLRHLEQAILRHDPEIAGPAVVRRFGSEPGERRLWVRDPRFLAGVVVSAAVACVVAAAVFVWSDHTAPTAAVTGDAVAIIDPRSNRVTGQIPVGATPDALALGAGSLWVANTADADVSRIDLASGRPTRTIAIGGVPLSLAVGRGAVWVVRQPADGPPDLISIDPSFDVVKPGRRSLPGDPGVAATVVAGSDAIWVATAEGLLQRLDPAGRSITASIDTGNNATSIAVGAGGVWAADATSNNVACIDPVGKLVAATTPLKPGPGAVAVGAAAVWTADLSDDSGARIDPATCSVTATIPVGRAPTGIAVGLGSVWVANSRDGTVSRIDPTRNRVTATIEVGGSPRAIVVGNGRVWVTVQPALVAHGVQAGGVARVLAQDPIDSLDPAIANTLGSWLIEYATCVGLFNYPDRPAPEGSRLVAEVAVARPFRSPDGRSYSFTIRPGFRFSPPSNARVTAESFKFSIERALSPRIDGGPAASFATDIVGEKAFEAGRAKHISGVRARGNTLTIRLTRPAPDLLSRLALPYFCPVPLGTPVRPHGLNTPIPTAGPYYVVSNSAGQGAMLKRNPNYHGSRPHSLDEIDYSVGVGSTQRVKEIEAGTADYTVVEDLPPAQIASLRARYGPESPAAKVGGPRYFVEPMLSIETLFMNTSRSLFANADLRKAVNYALDRRAIARLNGDHGFSVKPTDQFLEAGNPGFRATHIYPLTPDLARAKRLARGHGGRAVLYVCAGCRAYGQLLQAELKPIGIDVKIVEVPGSTPDYRSGIRGEPFDLAVSDWFPVYTDPANTINYFFDGRSIRARGNSNRSYFNEPVYNHKLAAAAALTGQRRYAAYAALEADLLKNAAPAAPLLNRQQQEFFSARVGCQVYEPIYGIDLAALCLRQHR